MRYRLMELYLGWLPVPGYGRQQHVQALAHHSKGCENTDVLSSPSVTPQCFLTSVCEKKCYLTGIITPLVHVHCVFLLQPLPQTPLSLSVHDLNQLLHLEIMVQNLHGPDYEAYDCAQDIRNQLQNGMTGEVFVQQLHELQKAAGMTGVALVDPSIRGVAAITLTGWAALSALVALVIVIVGGVVFGYRRFMGLDKPYTIVTKSGDV
jgi:hypothetical protein